MGCDCVLVLVKAELVVQTSSNIIPNKSGNYLRWKRKWRLINTCSSLSFIPSDSASPCWIRCCDPEPPDILLSFPRGHFSIRSLRCVLLRNIPPPPRLPSDPSTHPVDEDVSWQSGGGILEAAEAVHHAGAVKGQCDLCQTASCTREQEASLSHSSAPLVSAGLSSTRGKLCLRTTSHVK